MTEPGKLVGFGLTKDYQKAREFYEGKVGLGFVSQDQFALVLKSGENRIRISRVEEFTPRQGTVLGWEVSDIDATVSRLESRGVAFEKYPFVQDQERGIWTAPDGSKVAWFKDPDGNILSVSEHH